jgi:hypothetical protein
MWRSAAVTAAGVRRMIEGMASNWQAAAQAEAQSSKFKVQGKFKTQSLKFQNDVVANSQDFELCSLGFP